MKSIFFIVMLLIFGVFALGCQYSGANPIPDKAKGDVMNEKQKKLSTATLAGGCFWCVESDFEKVDGVVEVISGYTGGHKDNPTYEEVSRGETGHAEAVQVLYDPEQVSYQELLDVFWRHVDPTDPGGQFVDRGSQYRAAIFYHDDEQRRMAEESKKALEKSGHFSKPIVVEIVPAGKFFRAEEYHQNYYQTHSLRYKYYRWNSGRDQFLDETWGHEKRGETSPANHSRYTKPNDGVLREKLTPLQYKVTQREGTEPAFNNEYWDNKKAGIYVDIVSGEPLFSSLDKYDSRTGWPSYNKPLEPENIVEREDRSLFTARTEVRSRHGDSHLGHVFPDGPAPTGLRYCINSAALRFIPKDDLEKEGYGEYTGLFSDKK